MQIKVVPLHCFTQTCIWKFMCTPKYISLLFVQCSEFLRTTEKTSQRLYSFIIIPPNFKMGGNRAVPKRKPTTIRRFPEDFPMY